uniref:Uncharacterized protein n=2 Tax=unclassified Mycobacterium TaxID=2642494 RepID=A0A5Q5BSS9_MYCSS
MIANNPRLADLGSEANRQRAAEAGRQQAVLARLALLALQALQALQAQRPAAHRQRWMHALQHRISNPDKALAELGRSMTPPMTKHAYAALLRRALRAGGITADNDLTDGDGRQRA